MLAKQAITIGSSSGYNVKLLHDWGNFDLSKLMPVDHISLMPASWLSLSREQEIRQAVKKLKNKKYQYLIMLTK